MTLKALALAAAAALPAAGAAAAPIYATGIDFDAAAIRGTSQDRDDPTNALGDTLGDFFEIGLGAIADFTFGQSFTGFVTIVEVTFGDVASYSESVDVFLGRGGVFTFLASLSNLGATGPDGATLAIDGVYDTVRLVDTTTEPRSLGFDVDRIAVSPIPVPAAGLLLGGALAALALAGRARRMA